MSTAILFHTFFRVPYLPRNFRMGDTVRLVLRRMQDLRRVSVRLLLRPWTSSCTDEEQYSSTAVFSPQTEVQYALSSLSHHGSGGRGRCPLS